MNIIKFRVEGSLPEATAQPKQSCKTKKAAKENRILLWLIISH
jgi:hypothetical protein